MVTKLKASNKDLFDEVIDAGLCTYCGGCSGACPYMVPYKGRIVLLDNCTFTEGQCYQYCPRTFTDMDEISKKLFGESYSSEELGNVKKVLIARSKDSAIINRAQYGGTVTALLSLAMDEGIIDASILSKMSGDKTPEPFIARNKEELLSCAGSNYMACPTLKALNSMPLGSKEKLAVVTTPCQGLSLAKMRADQPVNRVNVNNVKLVIGLFCTWALSPDDFFKFLKKNIDLPKVRKFDIPPPPANRFDAKTDSDNISFSLDDVRKFIMPACAYCPDMTSEFADISVGAVEGIEGWNTIIIRTSTGEDLINTAIKKGIIETESLDAQKLSHLKEASLLKKKRALKNIFEKSGDKNNSMFLGLSKTVIDKLLG